MRFNLSEWALRHRSLVVYAMLVIAIAAADSRCTPRARASRRSSRIEPLWYQLRKKVGDLRPLLPAEVVGPFFNDEFGETFGNIYALTGAGIDSEVLKANAARA